MKIKSTSPISIAQLAFIVIMLPTPHTHCKKHGRPPKSTTQKQDKNAKTIVTPPKQVITRKKLSMTILLPLLTQLLILYILVYVTVQII